MWLFQCISLIWKTAISLLFSRLFQPSLSHLTLLRAAYRLAPLSLNRLWSLKIASAAFVASTSKIRETSSNARNASVFFTRSVSRYIPSFLGISSSARSASSTSTAPTSLSRSAFSLKKWTCQSQSYLESSRKSTKLSMKYRKKWRGWRLRWRITHSTTVFRRWRRLCLKLVRNWQQKLRSLKQFMWLNISDCIMFCCLILFGYYSFVCIWIIIFILLYQ